MRWTRETAISYIKENFGKSDFPTSYAQRVIVKLFGSCRNAFVAAGVKEVFSVCQISGCHKRTRSGSCPWCEMHYYRNRRHGNPETKIYMQYEVNEHCFDDWTQENAWLLGLFWSDGWAKDSNDLGITNCDYNLLLEAEKVLGGSKLIKEYFDPVHHYKLRFSSAYMSSHLKNMGLLPAKSLVVKWPTELPLELRWPFLRGVFDGDGCVSLSQYRKGQKAIDARIFWGTGSKVFAEQLNWHLGDLGINSYVLCHKAEENNKKNDFYNVFVLQQESLRKVFLKMYDCSNRKQKFRHDRFERWYNTPRFNPGRTALHLEFNEQFLYDAIRDYYEKCGKYPSGESGKVVYGGVETSWWFLRRMLKNNRGLRWHTRRALGYYLGVRFRKERNKWHASIGKDYKIINLGYYQTKEEAVEAREKYCERSIGNDF